MKTKILHLVLAVLFVLFAVVQLNDPDPLRWFLIYLLIAGIFAFGAFDRYNQYPIYLGMALCIGAFIILIPGFIDWVQMGMPSITSSMKATEPHIELTREFLGIVISLAALGYQYRRMRKISGQ